MQRRLISEEEMDWRAERAALTVMKQSYKEIVLAAKAQIENLEIKIAKGDKRYGDCQG